MKKKSRVAAVATLILVTILCLAGGVWAGVCLGRLATSAEGGFEQATLVIAIMSVIGLAITLLEGWRRQGRK